LAKHRVLFLIPTLERAGAESLLVNLVLQLSRAPAWQPEVCTLQAGYPYEKDLLTHGIALYSLNFRHRYDISQICKLQSFLHAHDYDIIHSHLFPANFIAALNHRKSKAKYVMTEHSIWNRRRSFSLLKYIDKLVYRRFDKIACVSNAVQRKLLKWVPEIKDKSIVIYNGVQILPIIENPQKEVDVLCVGNLNRYAKGIDILLESLKLAEEFINCVYIAGDGNIKRAFQQMANDMGLREKVHFLGTVNNVRDLMQQSKVFVLPSRWEGLPMALLEAMEACMPIIATSVGGIPEAITGHKNGILVPPEKPRELAAAIVSLLQSPELARILGMNARQTVLSQFSIEAHTYSHIHLYEMLLNGVKK
jgi:glycosyltransferase involved in cell wall biosynthesis